MNIKYTTFLNSIQTNIIALQKELKEMLDGVGSEWVITFAHNKKEQIYYCEYIHSSKILVKSFDVKILILASKEKGTINILEVSFFDTLTEEFKYAITNQGKDIKQLLRDFMLNVQHDISLKTRVLEDIRYRTKVFDSR